MYAGRVYARRCARGWTKMAQKRATWRVGSCRPGRGERAARAQTQLLFVQQYPPLAGCRVPRCRAMTGQDRAGQGMDGIEREEAGGGRKVCLSGLSTHGRSFPLIAAQAQGDVISQPSQPARASVWANGGREQERCACPWVLPACLPAGCWSVAGCAEIPPHGPFQFQPPLTVSQN